MAEFFKNTSSLVTCFHMEVRKHGASNARSEENITGLQKFVKGARWLRIRAFIVIWYETTVNYLLILFIQFVIQHLNLQFQFISNSIS